MSSVNVDWNNKFNSLILSIQYNPLQSVPLFSGCRDSKGDSTLDDVYAKLILVMVVPIGFVIFTMFVNRLILFFALRCGVKSMSRELVTKSLQDMTLKSCVWFSLFSFPILASR